MAVPAVVAADQWFWILVSTGDAMRLHAVEMGREKPSCKERWLSRGAWLRDKICEGDPSN